MSVWTEANRGDVWVDGDGKEHTILGVVQDGFDAICDGKSENYRSKHVVGRDSDMDAAAAAVAAKGGNATAQEEARKAAAPKWVDLDADTFAAIEGWERKGA